MQKAEVTRHAVEPWFDLEDFMNFSHESRLESQTLENLVKLWEEWRPKLTVATVQKENSGWLAVWLPQEIEELTDQLWGESPAQGFMANSLAQYLCMAALQELEPEIASAGCAPAPTPDQVLRQTLAGAGLEFNENGQPNRRFAVITNYPYQGSCEICNLKEACPRANGAFEDAQILLPGHEREEIRPMKKKD